jgi:hypothetical protein
MIHGEVLTNKGWRYPDRTHCVLTVDNQGTARWAKSVSFVHQNPLPLIRVYGLNIDFCVGPSTRLPFRKMTRAAVDYGATCRPGRYATEPVSEMMACIEASRGRFLRWANVTHPGAPLAIRDPIPPEEAVSYYVAEQYRREHGTQKVLPEIPARRYVAHLPHRPVFPGSMFDLSAHPYTLRICPEGFDNILRFIRATTTDGLQYNCKGDLNYLQAIAVVSGYRSSIHTPVTGEYLRVQKEANGPVIGPAVNVTTCTLPSWVADTTGIVTRYNGKVRVI